MGRVAGEFRLPGDVAHAASLRHGHVTGPCCRAPRRLDAPSRACARGPRLQHLCLHPCTVRTYSYPDAIISLRMATWIVTRSNSALALRAHL
jgi:hypothetical protein